MANDFVTSSDLLHRRGGWARNGKTQWHAFEKAAGGTGLNTYALCGVYLAQFTDLEAFPPAVKGRGKRCARCSKKRLRQLESKLGREFNDA